ncbi:glycoside hydrolase family 128 protein [Rhizoctonia solani]|uniref:Glycoside hydrolase family 128 protein n=1 Tax=Rhizoctonia solani TaxID=456999 RepID=A0A8H8SU30_9AGAM|nr:glycoside hydrolase family 128 protein [Rhizoctonia solani]QRW18084.1 glycoside hydrolase family 128 protein [Rhizoctonia solani]
MPPTTLTCFTVFIDMTRLGALSVSLLALMPSAFAAGKRGIAWPWYNEVAGTGMDTAKLANQHIQWIYNWETWRPAKTTNLNWIGMQRCMDCESSPIAQLQTRAAQQGWNTVLTLNEPDINNITPATAAAWYIQYINPLPIKKAIPSVTSSNLPGQGLQWAAQFISACAGRCFYDYVNVHWYGGSFADFKGFIEQAHTMFPDKEIIVTEFALQAPADREQQVTFLIQAMAFLDAASYVPYYSAFVATSPALFAANDPAGAAYVGLESTLFNNDGSLTHSGLVYTGAV